LGNVIRLNDQPFEANNRLVETRKPAMSALWINTKEQRSEGSFAGYPVNTLPAQFPPGEALRC
jgi:hypothetical protein